MNLMIIACIFAACVLLAFLFLKVWRWRHVLARILVSNHAGFAFFDANGACVSASGVVSDILPGRCVNISDAHFALALYGARAAKAFGSYFVHLIPESTMHQDAAFVLLDDGAYYLAQIFVLSTGVSFFILSDARQYVEPVEAYKMLAGRKASSMRHLATHVVHDLNNVVSIVDGYTRISARKTDDHNQPIKALEGTHRAMGRCRVLTQDLTYFMNEKAIQFTRKSERDVSLADMIDRTLDGFRRDLPASITFYADIADIDDDVGLPMVEGTFSTLFRSLLDNAAQAVDDDGVIHVAARLQSYGGQLYVCLDVEDNGDGIASQNLDEIFDLYHTTKQDKGHSGFGLARAQSIVDACDGHIYVSSHAGEGAHFTCILPVVECPLQMQRLMNQDDESALFLKGVTVLVVDDEDGILMTVESILQDAGATVLLANGSNEALMHVGDYADSIDVVLSDIVMPEMNGVKLAALVNSMLPDAPVLFMTGYAGLRVSDRIDVPEEAIVVKKPFEPEQMINAIMRAVGRNREEDEKIQKAI